MSDKIMTLHPEGKQGVNIERAKYDIMRDTIVRIVGQRPGITFTELAQAAAAELHATFHGSVVWYVTTVKLDLEARGVLERLPDHSPQRLHLKQA